MRYTIKKNVIKVKTVKPSVIGSIITYPRINNSFITIDNNLKPLSLHKNTL